MPIELTPIATDGTPDAYLSVDQARELAATLPQLTTLTAQTDATVEALLLMASLDLDGAMKYQGRKYDPSQDREFPRIPYPGIGMPNTIETDPQSPCPQVWDWDAEEEEAVVPATVKIACLYQAAWLLNSANSERIEAIRAGLASQSIGPASESYRADALAGLTGLGDRAQRLMQQYRLRSGSLQ